MTRTLLVARGVHTLGAGRGVRAVLVDGGRIAWTGQDPGSSPQAARTLDLGDAWVTPAFVDAHVHMTATGLGLTGIDLRGAAGVAECVARIRDHAARQAEGVLVGHGWDSFGWPEQRPLHAADVALAAPGRTALLSRVDGHSSVVDPATLGQLPLRRLSGVDRDAAGDPTGWLVEEASEAARRHVLGQLPPAQLDGARQAACTHAAGLGVASVHEMGHPGLSGLDDAVAWVDGRWPVDVQVWWADLAVDETLAHGLRPGGDLFLDGSIGSHTAAVSAGYPDGSTGELFHTDDAVAAFFVAATRAGVGAGVHAIGDRAIEQALVGLEAAAEQLGHAAVAGCRHRLEHVELATRDQVARIARLHVVASVQPAFDAAWGGTGGMYAERFGQAAALRSNPLRWFAEAGVRLAFGSDSTVTPIDPWGAVRAAQCHRGGLGVTWEAAVAAHTAGGRFVAGQDDAGRLEPGMRADLALWPADPRSAAPGDLTCLGTLVGGRWAHGEPENLELPGDLRTRR